jgi:DNA-binding GntR family transcriptional regulator
MCAKTSKILIDKNSVVKRVLDEMRSHIILGKYHPGSRVLESELAHSYDASRGTIRTALQELASEGLVEYLDNGGCMVVGLDEKNVRDTYQLRLMLELNAVEIILNSNTISFTPMMQVFDAYAEREKAPEFQQNQLEYFVDLDMQMHSAFMQITQNRPILRAWIALSPVIRNLLIMNAADEYREEFIAKFYDQHKLLLDYAILKDPRLVQEVEKQIHRGTEIAVSTLRILQSDRKDVSE